MDLQLKQPESERAWNQASLRAHPGCAD